MLVLTNIRMMKMCGASDGWLAWDKVDLIMIEFPSHALYESAPRLLNSKWRISIVDGD